MTAGTGVEHSEHNRNEDTPMRCIQTWILPKEYGLPPIYGSYNHPDGGVVAGDASWENTLRHLASNVESMADDNAAPVLINQDVDCNAAELEMGAQVLLELPKGRMTYMVCIEGEVSVSSESMKNSGSITCSSDHYTLHRHDGCEITGTGGAISITATEAESVDRERTTHPRHSLYNGNCSRQWEK